jgi:hypothetical protein
MTILSNYNSSRSQFLLFGAEGPVVPLARRGFAKAAIIFCIINRGYAYFYVTEAGNCPVQYFKDVGAVAPASLGRVKALFR